MSKNVLMQEHGVDEQFNSVSEIYTSSQASGDVWVPESETVLGTLTVTANGTYNAKSQGYYGFSTVNVNVPGGGTFSEKTINSNGYHSAMDDGVDGYSSVSVNVPVPIGIEFRSSPRIFYFNNQETVDLSSAVVVALMSDGSEKDITSECEFTPADGTVIESVTDNDKFEITVTWSANT